MMAGGTSALVPSKVVGCERRRSRTSSRLPSRFFAVSSAQTAEETEELVPLVRVGFSIRVKVGYGDTVAIVGSSPGLGEWNVARALKLSWSQDADGCDIWTGMAPLPEHWVLRYKFVVLRADGRVQWQPGDDLSSVASAAAAALSDESKLDIYRLSAALSFGERFLLVGSTPGLGSWDAAKAVPLQWGDANVWQSAVSLSPRGGPLEYKLLTLSAAGDVRWVEGHNMVVPGLESDAARAHAHAAGGRPITRSLHHQVEGYEPPFFWAAELGNADALVYLPDSAPLASGSDLTSDERAEGARSAAELARVRSGSLNGLSALTEVAVAAGGEGENVLRAAALNLLGGFADPVAFQKVATSAAAGAAAGATAVAATAAASGSLASVEGAMMAAALPMAEATALGLLVAFGAKNLLYAEDRERFLEAAGSRRKLIRLLRQNMNAIGVGGNSAVAAAVSKSAAEAGLFFDPLELFEDEDEAAERERSEASELREVLPLAQDGAPSSPRTAAEAQPGDV